MAKQKGIFKAKGTLDDMSFIKSRDGLLVKRKSEVDRERIATDPNFQRTRENAAEFGVAGKAGKLIRTSLHDLLYRSKDSRMVSRLAKALIKVIQSDLTSERGKRTVKKGNIQKLEGFDFNIDGPLSTTFLAPYTASIDRATGEVKVDVSSFIPRRLISAPKGATHFQLRIGGSELDFDTLTEIAKVKYTTDILPWNEDPTAPLVLTNNLTEGSQHHLFLVLGIEFFQETNGRFYSLHTSDSSSIAIVKASGL